MKLIWLTCFSLALFFSSSAFSQPETLPSINYQDGKLVYEKDSLGNQIPDYSYCGYQLSEKPIPIVPIKVVVPPIQKDATSTIQNAIDYVSALPLQKDGFRGAILLQKGIYHVDGRLKISASGVVLRGSGPETILKATGTNNENLISISGKKDKKTEKPVKITDNYVPVNSFAIQVETADGLKVDDKIAIKYPFSQALVEKLKMDDFGGQTQLVTWKAGEREASWDRTITKIEGNTIYLDAPITSSIDRKYGEATVSKNFMAWQDITCWDRKPHP